MEKKTDVTTHKVTKFEVKTETLNGYTDAAKERLQGAEAVILNMPERITSATIFAPKTPALEINGVPVAHLGNIIGITGQMKSGKTAVNVAMAAAAITGAEVLGLAVPDVKGLNVLYIDTEQAGHDTQNNIYNRICRLAGVTDAPNLYTYNLRGYSLGEMIPVTAAIFDQVKPAFVVIDGAADYVLSVNDDIGARNLIAHFLQAAEVHNALIVLVLHDNHNTEKSRGHLGSELDRKAEAVLITQKDNDTGTFTLRGKFYRSAGNVDQVQYSYNTDAGWFEFLQYTNPNGAKIAKRKDDAIRVVNELYKTAGIYTHSALCQRVSEIEGIGHEAARKRVAGYVKKKKISKKLDGQYVQYFDENAPF